MMKPNLRDSKFWLYSDSLSKDDNLTPTELELQEAFDILTTTYGAEDLEKNISKLNRIVVTQEKAFRRNPKPHYKSLRYQMFSFPEKRSSLEEYFKRTIAKVYIKHGYNPIKFKSYVQQNQLQVTTSTYEYRNSCNSLIEETYKWMEDVLSKEFEDILRLSQKQYKIIHSVFHNIHGCLSEAAANTFFQVISNKYAIAEEQDIPVFDLYELYRQVMHRIEYQLPLYPSFNAESLLAQKGSVPIAMQYKHFGDKMFEMQIHREASKHHLVARDDPRIWSPEMELQLIALYQEHKTVEKVRDVLKNKYPQESEFTDITRVRRKFRKIVRASIRCFQIFYQKHKYDENPPIPKMVEIDEERIKVLLGGPYELKTMLCEVYRQDWMSFRSIGETVAAVNKYVRERARIEHLQAGSGTSIRFID